MTMRPMGWGSVQNGVLSPSVRLVRTPSGHSPMSRNRWWVGVVSGAAEAPSEASSASAATAAVAAAATAASGPALSSASAARLLAGVMSASPLLACVARHLRAETVGEGKVFSGIKYSSCRGGRRQQGS